AALGVNRHDVARADHLGQPPVDHKGLAVRTQHDVARLEIAMNYPPAVGVLHRVADVEEPPQELLELDTPCRSRSLLPGLRFLDPPLVELLDRGREAAPPDEPHRVE